MQKIIAFIMSVVMLLGTLIPGLAGNQVQGVTTGDWLQMLDQQFGMTTYQSQEPYYANVPASNPYFASVQIAYEWGVINSADVINVDANVTTEFVAATLVRVAMLQTATPVTISNAKSLAYPAEVQAAVSLGLFNLDIFNRFNVKVISAADAKALLTKVYEMWQSRKFGTPAVEAVSKNVVDYSGDFAPTLQAAQITDGNGNVIQQPAVALDGSQSVAQSQLDLLSLIPKSFSFSLGAFNFGVKIVDKGFTLNVGATVCNGVKIQKTFDVSNLNVSTKFDGNLATKDIKEAYIRADYNLTDTTTLTGSYAASVGVDPSKLPAGSPTDFMTAAKAGALALMPGGGNKITVFDVEIPIPNCPAITITLDVNLCISVDGQITITITSSNVQGIEIVNNNVRVINDITYGQQTYDIFADVRFTVGLELGIKVLGYCVVDAEFDAGIGANINLYVQCDTAVYQLQMPIDLAIAIPYPTNSMNNALFEGSVKVYGLMSVSVGQNSPLLKLLGLTKTWVIYDENNCVLYNLCVESDGTGGVHVVPAFTNER